MPTITVNDEPQTFPDPITVADLLHQLGKDAKKLAVEVNRDLVPRTEHAARRLSDGDAVEIVTLVGGGSGEEGGGQKAEGGQADSSSAFRLLPSALPLKIGKFTFASRLYTG